MEFNRKGVNKGAGLLRLAKILGVDQKDTIAIGDNFNDLAMIQAAGLGIGVANAVAGIRPDCKFITERDHNHDAISEVIEIFALIFTLIIFTSTVSAMPDSRTTLICALSSMASYSGETNLLMLSMLHDHGWEINPIEEKFEKTRVRSFLISKPDENLKIISICGTENDKDLLTDIRFGKISYNDQAMVHRGFLNYTDELLNLIRGEILNFNGKIIVTGHSLGGAVAILTSARLIDLGISPDQIEVVTFGAPAVGDKIFADEISDRMNLTRFENDGDVIPKSLASHFPWREPVLF